MELPSKSSDTLLGEIVEISSKTTDINDMDELPSSKSNVKEQVKKSKRMKHQYSRDELMNIKSGTLSNLRPQFLNDFRRLEKNSSFIAVEKDDKKKIMRKKQISSQSEEYTGEKLDQKHNQSASINTVKNNGNMVSKTSASEDLVSNKNVKDRVKKEQDIVLSPQRRSFNAGCLMPTRKPSENTNSKQPESRDSRRAGTNSRLPSYYTFARKYNEEMSTTSGNKYGDFRTHHKYVDPQGAFSGPTLERRYNNNGDKDRKLRDAKYGRTFHYNGRYNSEHRREEEPEWMKNGPTSLTDYIELRGFEDTGSNITRKDNKLSKSDEMADKVKSNKSFERTQITDIKNTLKEVLPKYVPPNSDSESSSVDIDSVVGKQTIYVNNRNFDQKSEESDRSSPEKNVDAKTVAPLIDFTSSEDVCDQQCNNNNETNKEPIVSQYKTISLEDIFRMDLPDIIPCNLNEGEPTESKFSRWFRQDANTTELPVHDVKDSTKDFFSAFLKGGSSEDQIRNVSCVTTDTTQNLLTVLQQSGSFNDIPVSRETYKSSTDTGKLHSVEEIEAKIFGSNKNKSVQNKETEAAAFKEMLEEAVKLMENTGITNMKTRNKNIKQQQQSRDDNVDQQLSTCTMSAVTEINTNSSIVAPLDKDVDKSQSSSCSTSKNDKSQIDYKEELFNKLLAIANTSVKPPLPPPFSKINSAAASSQSSQSEIKPSTNATVQQPSTFKVPPEIDFLIELAQITKDVVLRPDVQLIMKKLTEGEMTYHQLIEQYKRTPPHHVEFRDSLLCILKILKIQSNSVPHGGAKIFSNPDENRLIPNMQKAFADHVSADSSSQNHQQNEPLIPKHPSLQTGLLKTVSVEQKCVPLKDLNLNRLKVYPANSVPNLFNAAITDSSSNIILPTTVTSSASCFFDRALIIKPSVDESVKLEETKPINTSATVNQTPATLLWSMSANDDNDTENKSKQHLLLGASIMMPYRYPPPPMNHFQNMYRPIGPQHIPMDWNNRGTTIVGLPCPVQPDIYKSAIIPINQRLGTAAVNQCTCCATSMCTRKPITFEEQATLFKYNTPPPAPQFSVGGPVPMQHFPFRNMTPQPPHMIFKPNYVSPQYAHKIPAFQPNVNFNLHGSPLRNMTPIAGKDDLFNRSIHPPDMLASRGQLPNSSPNVSSPNMIRVDEIERIQKATGK